MDDSSCTVEQAVYSVKLDSRQNFVNLEQCSSGVAEEDLRFAGELATRVALLDGRFESFNMFSFFLPNGTVAIGRLTPRCDRSIRDGVFYFQCLFADFKLFCDAGADPLMFMHLALNTTRFGLYRPGASLSSFRLNQKAPFVNIDSLKSVERGVGHKALALLVQSILNYSHTFFVSKLSTSTLVSAVFSLFPVCARRNLSFSAGLCFRGYSTRFVCAKTSDSRPLVRPKLETKNAFLDLDRIRESEDTCELANPWGIFVDRVLSSKATKYFLILISNQYDSYGVREHEFASDDDMSCEDVVEFGRELLGAYNGFSDVDDEELSQKIETENDFENDDGWPDAEDGEQEGSFGILADWQKEEDHHDGEEWKFDGVKRDPWEVLAESLAGLSKKEPDPVNSIQIFQVETDSDEERSGDLSTFQTNEDDDLSGESGVHEGELFEAETFEEQLKRRQRERERRSPADRDSDETETAEIQNVEDESQRFCSNNDDSGNDDEELTTNSVRIALSPFALLSAEFPEKDVSLRQLDALVRDVCKRKLNAQFKLSRFWKSFTKDFEPGFVERVREEYLRSLELLIDSAEDPEDECNRVIGVLDACLILSD